MNARLMRHLDWYGLIIPVVALLSAEILLVAFHYQGGSLARPSEIWWAALEALRDGTILNATRETLISTFSGLAIGVVIGLVTGTILGLYRSIYVAMEFPIEFVRPVPAIALIPIVLLIFGLGYAMEISLIAFTTTWPVLLLTMSAVRGVKPRLLEFSRLIGMNLFDRIFKIAVPAALPGIFVGIRLASGVALIIAVTIEIAANPLGLGRAIMQAQESYRPDLMFALLLWIGLIGCALNIGIQRIEARLFRGASRRNPQP